MDHDAGQPCLCHRLQTRQYDDINQSEIAVLRNALHEAPQLFRPPSTVRRKRASASGKLVETYSAKNALPLDSVGRFDIRPGDSGYARIYQIVQKADRLQRIGAYAFATLHSKSTSVSHILSEIQHAFPDATKNMVYRILHAGGRWMSIVRQLADIAQKPPQELLGVLCLFSFSSSWERAKEEDRRLALRQLCQTTDLLEQVQRATPIVADVLDQLIGASSFVYEAFSASPLSIQVLPAPSSSIASVPGPHTVGSVGIPWEAPSLAAARVVLSRGRAEFALSRATAPTVPSALAERDLSDDAHMLFLLVSNFDVGEPIPLALLVRGAAPRRRWTQHGQVEEVDAAGAGLAPELAAFLSDTGRLRDAYDELVGQVSVTDILHCTGDDYHLVLDDGALDIFHGVLSPALLAFWRQQALIVIYRAVPWKYLESINADTLLFLPHLRNALRGSDSDIPHLSTATRTDLALTLIEAVRFPDMYWKHFALAKAADVAVPAEDGQPTFLQMRIAENRCMLARIVGDEYGAASALSAAEDIAKLIAGPGGSADVRAHAAAGFTAVQGALNGIQHEQLGVATSYANKWSPLNLQQPSPLEEVVLFRHDMIAGRLLRFGGKFPHAQACLASLLQQIQVASSLVFAEELGNVTCDLADTLREQGKLAEAEKLLRAEIRRRQSHRSDGERDRWGMLETDTAEETVVDLALAEVLFARGDLEEAHDICAHVLKPRYRRFCMVRAHTIMARTQQVRGDRRLAIQHWMEALRAIADFTITYGYTTRAIYVSARHVMLRPDDDDLVPQWFKRLDMFRTETVIRGALDCYWSTGMQHWLVDNGINYLEFLN